MGLVLNDLRASTKIAGTRYYAAEKLYSSKKLKRGDAVKLQRDPSNLYDKNAIKILSNSGSMLGYIPRTFAEVLAPKMDSGLKVSANIKEIGRRDGGLRLRINLVYENLRKPTINKAKSSSVSATPQKTATTFRRPITPNPTMPKPVARPQHTSKPQPTISRNEQSQPSYKDDETSGLPWWGWVAIVLVGLLILGNM